MHVSRPQFGCTTFQLSAQDGTIVIGRAMDYPQGPGFNMNSQILTYNRGEACSTLAPDGNPGLEWTSNYGFIGTNAFGLDCIDDGLNQAGLSFAILTLPETTYQSVSSNEDKIALPISQLGKWALGNFSTCKEFESALKTVKVWGDKIAQINQVPLVHIAVSDSTGENLVVEFLKGKAKIHKNPVGVLTNEPKFEDHINQLKFFNGLSSQPAPSTTINGHVITSFLETGLDGMPGGLSSPARFVQAATHVRLMTKPQAEIDAVTIAVRLLGRLDVIPGMVNA
ncbi:MAG: linear amide C-N hydrolase, partial [Parachlamydiaceae bacterium]